jgi:hypothetical protein
VTAVRAKRLSDRQQVVSEVVAPLLVDLSGMSFEGERDGSLFQLIAHSHTSHSNQVNIR